jgi:hypothetical protein
MALTLLRCVVTLEAQHCVSQSQCVSGLRGDSRASGRVVSLQLREQLGISLSGALPMMVILCVKV